MAGILNIGTRALLANQMALQTAGNNIANVNTPGYSRQSVLLQSVEGQFSGAGFYGNGVEAASVLRSHDQFLTRQAALAGSVAASDSKRLERLKQLDDLFEGGPAGLGAAVSDMLDAFSDVANAPTDLSARTVALARVDEAAARFRAMADNLGQIRDGVKSELAGAVSNINSLAERIAKVNAQIVQASGSGQQPNDLLDHREQLIRELNDLVQTTSIPADDGSVGIFIGGSQALVLGTTASRVALSPDEFGDPALAKLSIQQGLTTATLDEATLGGGSTAGLLRFLNGDLVEAGNLVGRMALALGTHMNEQHRLGLEPNGAAGGDLFTLPPMADARAATANLGSATVSVAITPAPASGATSLAASDYEMQFTGATTGTVRRLSDGQVTAFAGGVAVVDGLTLSVSAGAIAGDRFLVAPFRDAAVRIDTAFASPTSLAMASPVAGRLGASNTGSLTMQSLQAQSADPNLTQTVTLTFTSGANFNVTGTGTGNPVGMAYVPGQAISFNGWSLTLKGAPKAGDSFVVGANLFAATTAGNAEALMAVRDTPMFDGAPASEGYASVMSQVGVRVQSASYAASVSQAIATHVESDRTAVSGVNLDEEAARLLQYQQAYQASAKMLQVSQSMFDSLLRNLGL
jgi:flagellar hook-associated protein 1